MTAIRPARADEAARLSALAFRSKAHWGYDSAFMAACRDELTLSAEDILAGAVRVHESGGFYRLSVAGGVGEVELFFVDADRIGRGVGRALWRDLAAEAARRGARELRVAADPFAEGFYRSMGCRRRGTVASGSIAGRRLPRLVAPLRRP